MQVRKIVLSAAGIGVLVLLGLLLIEVSSSPASSVPEDELARARAAHARMQSGGGASAVRALDNEPAARPEVRQREVEPEPDPEPEERRARPGRSPARPPSIVDRSATRPNITVAGRKDKTSFEARMDEVNGIYDRGNYMDAHEAALAVLEEQPRNVRMLRVAVSTSCILGEAASAATLYERLPEKDQRDMAKRCGNYGVEIGTR